MRDGIDAAGESGASAPRRSGCGWATLVAMAGVLVLFAALSWLPRVAGVPAYVRAALGDEPGVLNTLAFAALLFGAGLLPALVGLAILRKPPWSLALPVLALMVAGALGALWYEAFPNAGAGAAGAARLGLPLGYLALVLIVGSAMASAVSVLEWERAAKVIVSVLLMGLPWLALAHVMLLSVGAGRGSLVRRDPFDGHAFLALLVLLLVINGGAFGCALARWRGRALLGWAVATALLAGPGWLLLRLGLEPEVFWQGAPVPTLGLLLAPEPWAAVSAWDLFGRWAAVQGALVLVLALGHACALRLVGPSAEAAAAAGEAAAGAAGPAGGRAASRPPRRAGPAHPGRAYLWAGAVYAFLVVYGLLVPLEYHGRPFEGAVAAFLRTPYLAVDITHRSDLVANLLLFIPLGFLLMGGLSRENTRGGRWLLAALVTAGGAALALAIEFCQLYFPPRTVSQNDVMAECVGGAAGVALWALAGMRVTAWWRGLARPRQRGRLAVHILTGYVVALVLYQLFPYDFVLSADELVAKLQGSKLVLMPLAEMDRTALPLLLGTGILYVPVGYLAAVKWARAGRPVIVALGAGLVFTFGIELAQVFVFSRYSSATHALLGTAGAGLGGWLAGRFGPAARRPLPEGLVWRAVSLVLRAVLALAVVGAFIWGKWRPFQFEEPAGGLAAALAKRVRIPFYYQYWNSEFEATAQMLRDFLIPLALGMLLVSLVRRALPGRRLAAGLVAGLAGAAVEMGKVYFPPHAADLTTALAALVGGLLGAFLWDPFVEVFVRPGARAAAGEDAWWST